MVIISRKMIENQGDEKIIDFSEASPILRLGNGNLRDDSRQDRQTFTTNSGGWHDGLGHYLKETERFGGGLIIVLPLRRPDKTAKFLWKKRMGEPTCMVEWIVQHSWLLTPYIAVIVTIMFIVQMLGYR